MSWHIAVLGLVIGTFVGLSGVGAGTLTAPTLILLGIHPTIAVGTDLAYSAVTKLVGTARNASHRIINRAWCLWMILGSVPGTVIGTEFTRLIHQNSDVFVKQALGVVLILAAVAIVLKEVLARRGVVARLDLSKSHPWWIVAAGTLIGFLVGLTSIGSGSLFMIFLMTFSLMSPAEAVATDIANAASLTVVAGLLHLANGSVDLLLAGNLLVGSIPGILLGSRLAQWVPVLPLRYGIAVLVFLGGLKTV